VTGGRRELPVAARLGGFGAALAVAFAGAYGIGTAAAGPGDPGPPAARPADGMAGHGGGPVDSGAGHGAEPAGSGTTLPGLAVSQDGYTLVPESTSPYRFVITGPDGAPVTDYARTHEKDLHLIVVRRDLAGYRHLHPTLGADGRWTVPLDLTAAGTYRVLADFVPAGGPDLVLGTDLAVGGDYAPAALPAPATTSTVDGYEVTLAGRPAAGRETELAFTVRRGGAAVTPEPYLGAAGHLVSLRVGDLAYLHTHPGDGLRFGTTFPTAGTYRLFLDFRVGGTVRTAAFTVEVPA
jgi:hypothetical protein